MIEPNWILLFSKKRGRWWVRLLACGRYQHVKAIAYLPARSDLIARLRARIRALRFKATTRGRRRWPYLWACDSAVNEAKG